jgi:hypothetical protein
MQKDWWMWITEDLEGSDHGLAKVAYTWRNWVKPQNKTKTVKITHMPAEIWTRLLQNTGLRADHYNNPLKKNYSKVSHVAWCDRICSKKSSGRNFKTGNHLSNMMWWRQSEMQYCVVCQKYMDVLYQPDVSNLMVERYNTQGNKGCSMWGEEGWLSRDVGQPIGDWANKKGWRLCVWQGTERWQEEKRSWGSSAPPHPPQKIGIGPSATATWTGVQRLGGEGVKNEAIEETVDAAWLQIQLNTQGKNCNLRHWRKDDRIQKEKLMKPQMVVWVDPGAYKDLIRHGLELRMMWAKTWDEGNEQEMTICIE